MPEYTTAEVRATMRPSLKLCRLSTPLCPAANFSMKKRISQRHPRNFTSQRPAFNATASIFSPAPPFSASAAVPMFRKMNTPVARPSIIPYPAPSFHIVLLSILAAIAIYIGLSVQMYVKNSYLCGLELIIWLAKFKYLVCKYWPVQFNYWVFNFFR